MLRRAAVALTGVAVAARAVNHDAEVAGVAAPAAPALEFEAAPFQHVKSADDAWWGQNAELRKKSESAAELERMSSLLRRQLQDGAYSYLFSEGPSTMPSPMPSPLPTPAPSGLGAPAVTEVPTPGCEAGESLYKLALYDFGEDGWEGATYTITDASGDVVSTGTLASGGDGVDAFCLVDGSYTLTFGGGADDSETSVQFLPAATQAVSELTGPATFDFLATAGEVVAAPTPQPSPAPGKPTLAPVPAPTPSPVTAAQAAATAAPVPKPTPAPVAAVAAPSPTSPTAPTATTATDDATAASPTPAPVATSDSGAASGDATATLAPAAATESSSSSSGANTASSSVLIIIIVLCCLACALLSLLLFAYRNRERKLTERKDSWDISTMFTDEANLPDAEEMIDVEPEGAGGVAGAALVEGEGALVPLDEDQPQALQKITQAAEL